MVTGCYDGELRAYDASGGLLAEVQAHRKPIRGVAAYEGGADAGCVAATGSKDGMVHVWHLADGGSWRHTLSCAGHAASVEAVAFAPDGRRVRVPCRFAVVCELGCARSPHAHGTAVQCRVGRHGSAVVGKRCGRGGR